MANLDVTVRRSDKFPVGTVVGAYKGAANRHHEGKPAGTAAATATVAANGVLTFLALPEAEYVLWAEVEGANANLRLGHTAFVAPGTLKERVRARRVEVGA